MRKSLWLIVAVLVVVLAGLIIAKGQSVEPSKSLEIGVLLPLSSNFAWWGENIQQSIKAAQANGYGSNFKFVYADTKCNAKDAVSSLQSLMSLHPSMHIFIVGCDDDLKAVEPFLNNKTDLAFMVGLSDKSLYEKGFPTVNLAVKTESQATMAGKFAFEKLGVKDLGILVSTTGIGNTLNITLKNYFSSIGGRTTTETMKYNEPNPETSILKILQARPDAIYIENDIPNLSTTLKRLDQLGYKGHKILFYGAHVQALIDTAGSAAEGAYVPWAISDETNPARIRFLEAFKKNYSNDPFITAYFVYDGIILLDEANKACKGDARCIEEYFYDKSDFEGILGKVRYQLNGEVKRSFYYHQVKDGKFVEVK